MGFAANVLNKYFQVYFPRAIKVAQQLRESAPNGERLIYTTHPYLVELYVNCDKYNIPQVKKYNATITWYVDLFAKL